MVSGRGRWGLLAAALALGWAAPAAAQSFEFLFRDGAARDDEQAFLRLAVTDSGHSRRSLEPLLPRLKRVADDLPVALFVARESGRPLSAIVDLRAKGLSWSVILGRVEVSTERLFGGLERDPGPPYGKAWGYWRKHGRKSRLDDDDVALLARLQIGGRVSGLSPGELARQARKGRGVESVVTERKGRGRGGPPADTPERGKGKGKGKNKKDKGRGRS